MKKLNKILLEAIQRGINLAIDDFDDIQDVETLKVGEIKNKFSTKDQLEFRKWFINLGLPSGTWWGKYNIGVDLDKLDFWKGWFGGFYEWGEIISDKGMYSWSNYEFYNFNSKRILKYHRWPQVTADNLTSLQPEDDVATLTFKDVFNTENIKMPTKEQFQELIKYTTVLKIYNHLGIAGLNGWFFISKINNNLIFIPAAGNHSAAYWFNTGSGCSLWTSDIDPTSDSKALCCMNIAESTFGICSSDRTEGYNVRPVIKL